VRSVEGWVLRDVTLRTRSGPEGSSRKKVVAGAVGTPGWSFVSRKRPSRSRSTAGARSLSVREGGEGGQGRRQVAEEKHYQSLYRKYRPQTPSELLGQEHVTRVLTGAVRDGRLAHAFLFSGPRGTGKTSTARILAKMVNCDKGPTPDPCGVCEQCVTIRDGGHMDVREIDAASHGGVDDARELRERAPTAPAMGREKVYIIDEAQRLSREAFDALLKVFEEPPPGVRFVLATTEPHKIPATIVSRCQSFEFRRVGSEVLAAHLLRIAEAEDIKLSEVSADAIARHSEGSVRSALSVLDQAALLGGGEITADVLSALLGAPPLEMQYALADALAVGDSRTVFGLVNSLVQEGQDLRHVTTETLTHFRNLLIVHAAPDKADLVDATVDEYERVRAQASKFSPAELSRIIGLLLAAQADMRWTTSPRLTLELALVRAGVPEADPNPHALISRIERLERLVGVDPAPPAARSEQVAEAAAAPAVEPVGKEEAAPAESSTAQTPMPVATAGNLDVDSFRRAWPDLIAHLRACRQSVLVTFIQVATPITYDGETLELAFPPDRKFGVKKIQDREQELRTAMNELFGVSPLVSCVIRDSGGEVLIDADDELAPSESDLIARLQRELGAEISPDVEGGE